MKPFGKIAIALLAAAVTFTAHAQTRYGQEDRSRTQTYGQRQQEGAIQKVNKASDLVGMEVRNYQDERIGRIDDVVIDFEKGRVAYAVVSVGGFLGMGTRNVALPLDAFQPGQEGDRLFLSATREQLERVQDLSDERQWPHPQTQDFPAARVLGVDRQIRDQDRFDVRTTRDFREDRYRTDTRRDWQDQDRQQMRQPQQDRYQYRDYDQDRFDTRQQQQRTTDRFQTRDQREDSRQPAQQRQFQTQPQYDRQYDQDQQQLRQRRTDRSDWE
jgi:sporulation protein YlmC with PRC-barrel domain